VVVPVVVVTTSSDVPPVTSETPTSSTRLRATTAPSTTIAPVTDRANVRVVLANGAGAFGLLSATASGRAASDTCKSTGADMQERPGRSIVYFREGFE
jgi:hypothetical protein